MHVICCVIHIRHMTDSMEVSRLGGTAHLALRKVQFSAILSNRIGLRVKCFGCLLLSLERTKVHVLATHVDASLPSPVLFVPAHTSVTGCPFAVVAANLGNGMSFWPCRLRPLSCQPSKHP
jgi:hypothetical protein